MIKRNKSKYVERENLCRKNTRKTNRAKTKTFPQGIQDTNSGFHRKRGMKVHREKE